MARDKLGLRHYWLPAGWLVLIVLASLMPASQLPKSDAAKGLDKVIHAYLYGQLTVLLLISLFKEYRVDFVIRWPKVVAIASAVTFGILMELMQQFVVTSRAFEWPDILANTIGAVLGFVAFKLIYKE